MSRVGAGVVQRPRSKPQKHCSFPRWVRFAVSPVCDWPDGAPIGKSADGIFVGASLVDALRHTDVRGDAGDRKGRPKGRPYNARNALTALRFPSLASFHRLCWRRPRPQSARSAHQRGTIRRDRSPHGIYPRRRQQRHYRARDRRHVSHKMDVRCLGGDAPQAHGCCSGVRIPARRPPRWRTAPSAIRNAR
jgi:hypothetical protein